MWESEDPLTRALARSAIREKDIWALWDQCTGEKRDQRASTHGAASLPIDLSRLSSLKMRRAELKKWTLLQVQGQGVKTFRQDPTSNR